VGKPWCRQEDNIKMDLKEILVRKPERKIPLDRQDNTKTDLKETGCGKHSTGSEKVNFFEHVDESSGSIKQGIS
jgi:hypothetical protein